MSKPDIECTQRGMDLESIKKIIEAHKDQMMTHAHTATCYKGVKAVIKAYELRSTAPSDARQKYVKNSVDGVAGDG